MGGISGWKIHNMLLQGPHSFVLLGTFLLLPNVLGFCERPAWATVAWETPQDLEQLVTKDHYLHTSICQICHCFTGMGLSKWCLEVLHPSCKVAFLIVVGLSINYLISKLKLAKKPKPCQAMFQTSAVSITTELKDEYTYNRNKMLCRLVTNTSKMMKYMKRVAHHQKKEAKYHQLGKKRKGDDNEEDKELFSICPHNNSSSEDTIMHEI